MIFDKKYLQCSFTACRCSQRSGGCATLQLSSSQTSLGGSTLDLDQQDSTRSSTAEKRKRALQNVFKAQTWPLKKIFRQYSSRRVFISVFRKLFYVPIYNWPPWVPIKKGIEVSAHESKMFKVYFSENLLYFVRYFDEQILVFLYFTEFMSTYVRSQKLNPRPCMIE